MDNRTWPEAAVAYRWDAAETPEEAASLLRSAAALLRRAAEKERRTAQEGENFSDVPGGGEKICGGEEDEAVFTKNIRKNP